MSLVLHDTGDSKRVTATFKDIDDVNADPTTVIFRMRKPDGTITEYTYPTDSEIVRTTVGIYYVEWVFDTFGYHNALFQGTGTITTADRYFCFVKETVPTPA